MAKEFSPQGEIEVMSRRQAEGLVRMGVFDLSGMDPMVDRIFDPGVLGIVRRDGELQIVTDNPWTDQELRDVIRILAEDAKLDTEGAEALLHVDLTPGQESDFPTKPPGSGLTDLIEDWE